MEINATTSTTTTAQQQLTQTATIVTPTISSTKLVLMNKTKRNKVVCFVVVVFVMSLAVFVIIYLKRKLTYSENDQRQEEHPLKDTNKNNITKNGTIKLIPTLSPAIVWSNETSYDPTPFYYPTSNLPLSYIPTTIIPTGPTMLPTTYVDSITTVLYIIGDIPYSTDQAQTLKEWMQQLPSDAEFVIHVGDIRTGRNKKQNCKEYEYNDVANILKLSHAPVFVLGK
jgi:hypothetical protein